MGATGAISCSWIVDGYDVSQKFDGESLQTFGRWRRKENVTKSWLLLVVMAHNFFFYYYVFYSSTLGDSTNQKSTPYTNDQQAIWSQDEQRLGLS